VQPSEQQSPVHSVTINPLTVLTYADLSRHESIPDSDLRLLLISGTKIMWAQMDAATRAVPRHIPLQATPSRIVYAHDLQALIVAVNVCDEDSFSRTALRIIDPDSGEDITRPVNKSKEEVDYISGLGKEGERTLGLQRWQFKKENHSWWFILVCTSGGRVLVIDTKQVPDMQTSSGLAVQISTRHKFKCEGPITAMVAGDEGLFYCDNRILKWEVLDIAQKRFKKIHEYELPSPATSLVLENGTLYALTRSHSLITLELDPESAMPTMRPCSSDEVARHSLHMISTTVDNMCMVTDLDCTVTGLWCQPSSDFTTIFEAELPSSIFRLRKCSTSFRGPEDWLCGKELGAEIARLNNGDVLGNSIDGSMYQFTILEERLWRLLRFVQNLAERSPQICPYTYNRIPSSASGVLLDCEPVQK
jgi:hypothetical protein